MRAASSGTTAALGELDERVHIDALIGPERGRQPLGEAGLGELAAAPGGDGVALGSVWFEDGPHVRFVSAPGQFLPTGLHPQDMEGEVRVGQ